MRIILSSSLLVALGLLAACNGSPAAGSAPSTVAPVAPRPQSAASPPSAEPAATATAAAVAPEEIPRISVAEAHAKVSEGKALLVCAYGDRSKCASLGVKSGMTWVDFAEKLPELDQEQVIILYCA